MTNTDKLVERYKPANIKAMAQAIYDDQCEYTGSGHEHYCVQKLETALQSFEDKIEQLSSRLQAAEARCEEWISVKDRLPDTGDDCMCCVNQDHPHSNDFATRQTGRYENGWYYPSTSMHSSQMLQHVTHWQPLPEPPSEE